MFLCIGSIIFILTVLIAFFIVYTMIDTIRREKELISKKHLAYLIPSFFLLYVLLLTASVYNGETIDFFFCYSLFAPTVDALAFKISSALAIMRPIITEYVIFYIDFVLALIISIATVILSVASFFSQRIRNYFSWKRLFRRNCDIVIGDSKDAIKYLRNNRNCLMWGIDIPRQRYVDLLKEGIVVYRSRFNAKSISGRLKYGEHHMILFRDSRYSYSAVIGLFSDIKKKGNNLSQLHLEANLEEMKIIREKFVSHVDEASNSFVSCFNRHELLARKFIMEHPISKYIPGHFFHENCTLKSNKDINVVFIGFGKVNYELFRMMTMQFQFATEKRGHLASKPVHYYIFDHQNERLHNEHISKLLYEFDEDFRNTDFPKPDRICDLKQPENIDINSIEAKKKFRSLVTEDSFTYFIISLHDDFEDASYAQTIRRILSSDRNYKIFVRAKNNNNEKMNVQTDSVIYFGDERSLYSHDCIVNNLLQELSQRINVLYSMTNAPEWLSGIQNLSSDQQYSALSDKLNIPKNRLYMLKQWEKLSLSEQYSNLYNALNMFFKLNLLGFDLCKKQSANETGITEAEYDARYNNTGKLQKYEDYSFYFGTSVANVLAFIEHARWNAFYILADYVQMKKCDMRVIETEEKKTGNIIRTMPHKNTALKQHACITTYEGLDELIRFKFHALFPDASWQDKNGKMHPGFYELSKIYAYDYMDLDRIYKELLAMGYIIKKKPTPEQK